MTKKLDEKIADAQTAVNQMRFSEAQKLSKPIAQDAMTEALREIKEKKMPSIAEVEAKMNGAAKEIEEIINNDIRRDRPTSSHCDMLYNELRQRRVTILRRIDDVKFQANRLIEQNRDNFKELQAVNTGLDLLS
ncbi:MAG: hypothetical protein GY943_30485 [Chloroflexi bacterium]|nr:hypothetical protein [Chloroflexota bacterium]